MGEPIRALIVEDSDDDALLLVRELERGGYEVTTERVETPSAMTATLDRGNWDIVFADYTMPSMNGMDALELLKQRAPEVPVIFVSGTIGEDTAVEAMRAGARDYLIKGSLKRLIPAVRRELREAELRRLQKGAEEQLKRQEKRLWALYEIGLAISTILELPDLLNVLVQKIDLFLPYSVSTVRLLNPHSGEFELVAYTDIWQGEWRAHLSRCSRTLDDAVVKAAEPVAVSNVPEKLGAEERAFCHKGGLISYLGVPLIDKGEFLGVLGSYKDEQDPFEQEEVRYLSMLASQVGIAIHNAQLYEQVKSQAMELEKAKI